MAKKLTIIVLFQLLMTLSFTASAHSCGTDPSCGQSEIYTETFTTTSFTEDTLFNKYYFNFDAIQEPGDNFEITGATLTVTTNSNGWSDSIWIKNSFNIWQELGYLEDKNSQEFTLGESFFDEIMDGANFKAWFSWPSESITSATLTVNGKYCPPPSSVPVPAAVWLFGSAFVGLIGFGKRRNNQS